MRKYIENYLGADFSFILTIEDGGCELRKTCLSSYRLEFLLLGDIPCSLMTDIVCKLYKNFFGNVYTVMRIANDSSFSA